jgi:hypothetical protein
MKETNRSGYEIRLDVLKLAEGIENGVYCRAYDIAHQYAEKNNTTMELPVTDQVSKTLATAERLYAFVAEKGE